MNLKDKFLKKKKCCFRTFALKYTLLVICIDIFIVDDD